MNHAIDTISMLPYIMPGTVGIALILYNNRAITLTMSVYSFILEGSDGAAMAFASVTTLFLPYKTTGPASGFIGQKDADVLP